MRGEHVCGEKGDVQPGAVGVSEPRFGVGGQRDQFQRQAEAARVGSDVVAAFGVQAVGNQQNSHGRTRRGIATEEGRFYPLFATMRCMAALHNS